MGGRIVVYHYEMLFICGLNIGVRHVWIWISSIQGLMHGNSVWAESELGVFFVTS